MDLNDTFRKCLLLWDMRHKGKGSYNDFIYIASGQVGRGISLDDLLRRFIVLIDLDDRSIHPDTALDSALIRSEYKHASLS